MVTNCNFYLISTLPITLYQSVGSRELSGSLISWLRGYLVSKLLCRQLPLPYTLLFLYSYFPLEADSRRLEAGSIFFWPPLSAQYPHNLLIYQLHHISPSHSTNTQQNQLDSRQFPKLDSHLPLNNPELQQ